MDSSLLRRLRGVGHPCSDGARSASVLLVLPVSIAWAVDDDDVAVVEQAFDEGSRAEVIAEVVAPASHPCGRLVSPCDDANAQDRAALEPKAMAKRLEDSTS